MSQASAPTFGDPKLPGRFWSKVEPQPDGCWHWTAYCRSGYGQYAIKRVMRNAHRVAYTALVGAIPEGLVLDHLCRVTRCVNPAHLEAVTQLENLMRGDTVNARRRRSGFPSHCLRGHRYDEPKPGRKLRCATCAEISRIKYRQRHAA